MLVNLLSGFINFVHFFAPRRAETVDKLEYSIENVGKEIEVFDIGVLARFEISVTNLKLKTVFTVRAN